MNAIMHTPKSWRADVERIRRWERKQAREQEKRRLADQCFAAECANSPHRYTIHMVTEVHTNVDANGCVQTFTQ